MKKQVSAIICAYNNQSTIENILKGISDVPDIHEIIVINNGSQDSTGHIINFVKSDVRLSDIHWIKNRGKGYAMAKGIEISTTDYLIFIDAGLTNLTANNVHQLLNPLTNGNADMVLGSPHNALFKYKLNPFKNLTYERAVKKSDIILITNKIKDSRFGAETLINLYYRTNKKIIKQIRFEKLLFPLRLKKSNPAHTIKELIMEGIQVLKAIVINLRILIKPQIQNL